MIKKIFLIGFGLILSFLIYVSTRDSKFDYKRSGLINSTPEKIYPYLTNFKLGKEWNPYDQKDPNIKRNFFGTDGVTGAKMEFEGNSEAGAGHLELLKTEANKSSLIKLVMTKPFHAENYIEYSLTSEANATRFTWRMYGDGGYMGKLIGVFIDCEAMITKDFDRGILNLKKLIEQSHS